MCTTITTTLLQLKHVSNYTSICSSSQYKSQVIFYLCCYIYSHMYSSIYSSICSIYTSIYSCIYNCICSIGHSLQYQSQVVLSLCWLWSRTLGSLADSFPTELFRQNKPEELDRLNGLNWENWHPRDWDNAAGSWDADRRKQTYRKKDRQEERDKQEERHTHKDRQTGEQIQGDDQWLQKLWSVTFWFHAICWSEFL